MNLFSHKPLTFSESVGIMVHMMRDKEILLETTKGLGQQDTEYISLIYKGLL